MSITRTSRAAGKRTASGLHRRRWQSCLSMLVMFTIFAQSLLTIGCGLDELPSDQSAAVTVAAELPAAFGSDDASAAPDKCVACGGLVTLSGCCAHGVALSQRLPELSAAKAALLLPAAVLSDLPQDSPSDLFRPPILV